MILTARSGRVYSLYFRVKGLIKFDTGWLKVDKVAVVGLFFSRLMPACHTMEFAS